MSEPVLTGRSDVSEEIEGPRLAEWPPRTVLDGIALAAEALALIAFAAVIVITLLQVVARYALHLPLPWTEELARLLFIASMMIGIALATRNHENIVVDFLFVRLSTRGKALAALVFNATILVLLAFWLRGAVRLVGVNANATFVSVPSLRVGDLYLLEAGAIVLTAVFVLADMSRQIGLLRSNGGGK